MSFIKIFYDENCPTCSSFAIFISQIKDVEVYPNNLLLINSGAETLDCSGIVRDSIVVISENSLLTKSSAIIFLLKKIPRYRFFAVILSLLPFCILDLCYNFLSNRRLWIFKKTKFCKINNSS